MSEQNYYAWDVITYGEGIDSCLKMCHEYDVTTDHGFAFVDECLTQIVMTLELCLYGDGWVFGLIQLGLLRQKLARLEYEYLESRANKYQESHN